MDNRQRVVFMGTPAFALPALQAVSELAQLVAVYTQPDRPAGRGRKLRPSPVKQWALQHQLPVYQPSTLNHWAEVAELAALRPSLLVVVAYGQLLSPRILASAPLGAVNIHASLLPRWRGAAPIQRALLAGDTVTGVSIMQLDQGLDTGPVYSSRALDIAAQDTAASVHDKLASLGAQLLVDIWPQLVTGGLQPLPQVTQEVCYAAKISRAEACLSWEQPAVELARQVRALNPWPVAFTQFQGRMLRVWHAEPLSEEQSVRVAGTVMAAGRFGIDVQTGVGQLRLLEVQPEGKRRMAGGDFAAARTLVGQQLG